MPSVRRIVGGRLPRYFVPFIAFFYPQKANKIEKYQAISIDPDPIAIIHFQYKPMLVILEKVWTFGENRRISDIIGAYYSIALTWQRMECYYRSRVEVSKYLSM